MASVRIRTRTHKAKTTQPIRQKFMIGESEREESLYIVNNDNHAAIREEFELIKNVYRSCASPGVVDLHKHRVTGQEIIVKHILKSQLISLAQVVSATRELEIHHSISHPNIVTCLGTGENDDSYLLVLEFIPDFDYFRSHLEEQNKPFCVKRDGGVEKLRAFAFDILNGLEYLHTSGFIHLDLKPANLLLDRNVDSGEYPKVKICDFGLSRRLGFDGSVLIEKRCGTDAYMAPEVRDHSIVTPAADIWSFGLILYQLAVGFLPSALKWRPGERLNFVPRYWRKYEGTGLIELIENCLKLQPGERIKAADALTHRWFTHNSNE